MRYSYQVYTNSSGEDRDYYRADLAFSYKAFKELWIPFGSDYQGYLCVF